MKCRNILTVATLTGAAMTASAMAQTTIYTCNFDNPPYNTGSIDAQQSWVTAQAAALAPGLTSMAISTTAGSLAPQAGNRCFFSQNGPDATTSGRFAFQAGAGKPIIDAINTACSASATSIEFSCYMVPPTPTTSGTSLVGARHGRVQRQQRVYAALGEAIRSGALHAVNIRALTAAEAGAAAGPGA